MDGTIAPTDYDWYRFLRDRQPLDEVNFWTPSATRVFRREAFTPFFFKLKAPHRAICGFGWFVRWSSLPAWMAWECFGEANGCASLEEMRARIGRIRERMQYRPRASTEDIGCIVIAQPTFFEERDWIPQPADWPERSLTPVTRSVEAGEWQRVWQACFDRAVARNVVAAPQARWGAARPVRPRLGQGAFRVLVTEAYGRACAVTGEHSLPVLEAAHIKPFARDGAHDPANGLLLRADLHRLFDRGYVTIDADLKVRIGDRLRVDFQNGRAYYPLAGHPLRLPERAQERPDQQLLAWHREHVFLG